MAVKLGVIKTITNANFKFSQNKFFWYFLFDFRLFSSAGNKSYFLQPANPPSPYILTKVVYKIRQPIQKIEWQQNLINPPTLNVYDVPLHHYNEELQGEMEVSSHQSFET